MFRRLFLAFTLTSACLLAERYSLDMARKMTRVADPQIAPDGKSIAVLVSRPNYEENRFDAELVLIDVASKGQRTLSTRRGVTQPRWSPDGTRLGFLALVEGKAQVFVLPMAGGEAAQVTKSPEAVQQYAWRPDGKMIAFVAKDEAPKKTGEERHNKSFEAGNNDIFVTEVPRPAHLWVAPAAGGAAKRVTSGSWTLPQSLPPSAPSSPVSWSPDGKSIAFVKVLTPYTGDGNKSTVQIVEVESGAMRPLTGRAMHESQPMFSPDGTKIAHWFPRDNQRKSVNEIYAGPAGGGETSSVTRAIDRNVQRAIWMADSKSLLVSANDGTGVSLWVQPLQGAAKRIETGTVVPTAAFWLDASMSSGGALAFTGSEPSRPPEVYFLASADSRPERLTDFNANIAALELGRVEKVGWQCEKYQCDGVVTYPPDFDPKKKYPLVLYIHGGPRSASKTAFSPRAQLLAAQGWVVFEPNYRGSDNLGNAFQEGIWNDAGAGPGRDTMLGVDMLIQRGFVDPARMAPTGWSYGGYMTTWLLGNYPDRWKAAVAGAAVTDNQNQYDFGDANVMRGGSFGGSPYTDPKRLQAYKEQSPIAYAPRIKAPTLILSNTGDYRVPITQSYSLYHALSDNGIPTQFIAYPLGGHSPTDPVHMMDVDRRWIAWLKTYLQ